MVAADIVSDLSSRLDPYDLKSMFPGQIADEIRKIVIDMLRKFDPSKMTPEQKQMVLDSARTFYDTVLRPIDIPYIPAVAERLVDDWIWASLESMIRNRLAI